MGAGASTHRDADPAAVAAAQRGFAPMDAPMVAVIAAGDLRLLKAEPLRDGSLCEFARLQDLEAARGEVFHSPADAAALMSRGTRCVLILSHAWWNGDKDHPDFTHVKLRAVRHFLELDRNCHIEAVFIDYMCVPQVEPDGSHKRSADDQARYERAAKVMPAPKQQPSPC